MDLAVATLRCLEGMRWDHKAADEESVVFMME
jgi:hypothetical protein